jgi:hypothetical protein
MCITTLFDILIKLDISKTFSITHFSLFGPKCVMFTVSLFISIFFFIFYTALRNIEIEYIVNCLITLNIRKLYYKYQDQICKKKKKMLTILGYMM